MGWNVAMIPLYLVSIWSAIRTKLTDKPIKNVAVGLLNSAAIFGHLVALIASIIALYYGKNWRYA